MSKSRQRAADNYPPGVTGTEPQITGEVGSPNGAGTNAPGEPSLSPPVSAETAPTDKPKAPEETKSQRFRRLANRRLAKAVKAIGQLIPLAGKGQYESGPEEREILLSVLSEALMRVKSAFSDTKAPSAPTTYFR